MLWRYSTDEKGIRLSALNIFNNTVASLHCVTDTFYNMTVSGRMFQLSSQLVFSVSQLWACRFVSRNTIFWKQKWFELKQNVLFRGLSYSAITFKIIKPKSVLWDYTTDSNWTNLLHNNLMSGPRTDPVKFKGRPIFTLRWAASTHPPK